MVHGAGASTRAPSSTGDDTYNRYSADGSTMRAKSASAPFLSRGITTRSFLESTVHILPSPISLPVFPTFSINTLHAWGA